MKQLSSIEKFKLCGGNDEPMMPAVSVVLERMSKSIVEKLSCEKPSKSSKISGKDFPQPDTPSNVTDLLSDANQVKIENNEDIYIVENRMCLL